MEYLPLPPPQSSLSYMPVVWNAPVPPPPLPDQTFPPNTVTTLVPPNDCYGRPLLTLAQIQAAAPWNVPCCHNS